MGICMEFWHLNRRLNCSLMWVSFLYYYMIKTKNTTYKLERLPYFSLGGAEGLRDDIGMGRDLS